VTSMLTRIMALLRPRRLRELEAELDRRAAQLDALGAHLVTLYRRAGLPSPFAAAVTR
jgi:hypothetical protein